tara:strand:- start:1468 stop:2295 length:828 start_codon:yes stop_codon:yes gene_type:complete
MHEVINLKIIKEKYNIIPKKHLGQNFIFDQNILNKIINNILPIKNYNIIEIGPGPGGLTLAILKNNPKKVILIEKDSSFNDIIKQIFSEYNYIKSSLIIEDFLNLNLEKYLNHNTKIISNLPYYLSTQILLKVLPFNTNVKEVMFTFQKEVADRIVSKPNSKNYSRLSVMVQSVCDIKKKQNLPAQVFYPMPKVNSTVLVFTSKKKIVINNFNSLKELTKLAFNKRRKSIKNALKSITNISYFLNELNIEHKLRPEQITVEKFCKLANLIYKFKK